MSNFTLVDLKGIAFALPVWCVLSVGPGFVLGHLSNAVGFRRRTFARQLQLAIMLSTGVMPILYYLIVLAFGFNSVFVANGLFAVSLLAIAVLRRRPLARSLGRAWRQKGKWYASLWAVGIWTLISTVMLVDVQIGKRLYLSGPVYDYLKHIAVADAIARSQLPPVNPMFFPGHAEPLYYYYFWHLICAVIAVVTGSRYDTRAAVLAGAIWTGWALLATFSFASGYFRSIRSPSKSLSSLCHGLVFVANLYVLVCLTRLVRAAEHGVFLIMPNMCGWDPDQVTPIITAMIWVPQHVSGLIAGVTASILILAVVESVQSPSGLGRFDRTEGGNDLQSSKISRRSRGSKGSKNSTNSKTSKSSETRGSSSFAKSQKRIESEETSPGNAKVLGKQVWQLICAGACCASTAGLSIYLGIGFAATFFAYAINCLIRKKWIALAAITLVGIVCVLIALPFLQELTVAGSHHQFPIKFEVRHFGAAAIWLNHKPLPLFELFFLPFNYLFGFGLIALGAIWFWRQRGFRSLTAREQMLLVMTGVCIVLGSFFRTTIHSNDFGWRILLPVQFCLILWTAQFLSMLEWSRFQMPKMHWSMWLFAVLGISTSVYEIFVERFWEAPWLHPEHALAVRTAYANLNERIAGTAVVQHNPSADFFDSEPFFGLYGHHQVVASDDQEGVLLGPSPEQYDPVAREIKAIFGQSLDAQTIERTCQRYHIDVLLVKDTDQVWKDKSAAVWQLKPIVISDSVAALRVERAGE